MDDILKWQFCINGHPQRLRQDSEHMRSRYFGIHGGIDHWHDCRNDDFRLSSVYFEEQNDPELVWQLGYELTSLFNGVSKILDQKHLPISLEKLLLNNSPVVAQKPEKEYILALLNSPQTLSIEAIQQELDLSKKDPRTYMLNLATEREDVYLLLKYFEMPLDWVGLYKIFETLKNFSHLTKLPFNPDESAKSSFTFTANKYQYSGLLSRHGFTTAIKNAKTPTMTLDEAYAFVSNLAKEYLNQLGNLILHDSELKKFKLPK